MRRCLSILLAAAVLPATASPPTPVAELDVPAYMGTWYQVAWFPNRFQSQCLSDTTATYRRVPEGVEVVNRCRREDGRTDSVTGLARPAGATLDGDKLRPATLEVSFLPRWLRWLPVWGDYWVLKLGPDGRYAVVSEARRSYLWILSRTPTLAGEDEADIRSFLKNDGFDLSRWQNHPHPNAPRTTPRPPGADSAR
ncbi:MAG: lipocalin family protein [Rubrivivax sp.]|jgi:apolipoprotein D and lipocalin family protein|nr:lipocalin family protein [Rubrivivax sp.]